MTNPNASFADMLTENVRLRAENAVLSETNTDLKARLAISGASGLAKAASPGCSVCGTACAVCSSSKVAEEVALPMELLLMIAEHFEPGTRNLLNFARPSRHLYDLLLPRLYERIKVPDSLSVLERSIPTSKSRTSIATGLVHVRVLDLVTPGDQFRRLGLIRACKNLVELRIPFTNDHTELFLL